MIKTIDPTTIHTVLLLGSGALKIGEAGEFDYSGTQAIKALKEEGKRVILINPNIATIQTSDQLADKVYFLPVKPFFVEEVIKKEKPQGIMLSFGGQTALNCGMELYHQGTLKKHQVAILGTPIKAVIETEDRQLFSQKLSQLGLKTAHGAIVSSVKEGLAFAEKQGYPVMLRTGYALGGTGSGVARDKESLEKLLTQGLATSPQLILEESLAGWKEIEYEVVRDKNDNCVTVCNMENFDPVGIHTGESIVVAPSQTLSNEEYYRLRQISIDAIRAFKIVGECNIQFALHPKTSDYRIIEVNARLSRSSALASKATGYPLAYIAAKLALGKTLPELRNQVTQTTSAFFEPALDYIVVKMPRWDLDKYTQVTTEIGSEMKSVGEVMSIGRTFEEAIQKASRMLNNGWLGVIDSRYDEVSEAELLRQIKRPDPHRLFAISAALSQGVTPEHINQITGIDLWFLTKLATIAQLSTQLKKAPKLTPAVLKQAKQTGFGDKQLSRWYKKSEASFRSQRIKAGITPVVKRIDTMAGEFPAKTNYLYLTYHGSVSDHESAPGKKAIVIGGGPYSIGTSVEFDWCAVNTIQTLRKNRVASIMINCNPETVSTDYDISDYLYFDELTFERVLDIHDIEQAPCIVSVGGQIPNNLASALDKAGVAILGTTTQNIYRAEHRRSFSQLLDQLDIPQPLWVEATSPDQALKMARKIGFPILVRPSFVLSGKAMSVLESEQDLDHYLQRSDLDFKEHPLVLTRFLQGATECDFDGVAQKGRLVVHALSEHVESGGVHSGDSTLLLPPATLSSSIKDRMLSIASQIIKHLEVDGPCNIQFLIEDDIPYVIECNLRASRSFPFVSKVMNINMIEAATNIMLGHKVKPFEPKQLKFQAVKAPQFSFHKLRGADPILRVEMSSTGEVAAFGKDLPDAYLKAVMATGMSFPDKKAVLLSLGGSQGKLSFLKSSVRLAKMGYTLYATRGTAMFLRENGFDVTEIAKLHETRQPNISQLFQDHLIDFAVVLPARHKDHASSKAKIELTDGYQIRRMAIDFGIPVVVNSATAAYYIESLYRQEPTKVEIKAWQEYVK